MDSSAVTLIGVKIDIHVGRELLADTDTGLGTKLGRAAGRALYGLVGALAEGTSVRVRTIDKGAGALVVLLVTNTEVSA